MITLKPYRRAGVPLLAIQTADPAEVFRLAADEADDATAVLGWDCLKGLHAVTTDSQTLADQLNQGQPAELATANPIECLKTLERLAQHCDADDTVTIVTMGLTAHFDDAQSGAYVRQAVWNLRDVLSAQGAILVLCVEMGWINPFPDDVAVTVMPLPNRDKHIETANLLSDSAGVEKPNQQLCEAIGDALLGLSGFAAEQALALSISKKGIDLETLRERKRQQISETPGLSVYTGKEKFKDLGGLDQAKELFGRFLKGKRKPGCIVFIDEIEKSMAGSRGDSSGVSQDMLGYLLTYMQDSEATGSIFVGPPGAAKSAMAKAIGNEGDIPTVIFDLGAIKGSLVGESEGRMRKALAVITSISGGKPFFVATCNAIATLPPELRRRFTLGTMFYDLPTPDEARLIWDIYIKKFSLDDRELPDSTNWTGAEIKQCCDLADRLGVTLVEAATYVVPVAVAAKERIESLRQEASGRYLNAGARGIYEYQPNKKDKKRRLSLSL